MKSEKDFLQDMWGTVLKLEFEEHQKELAIIENKRFIKWQLSAYACVVAVFCLVYYVFMVLPLNAGFTIYIFCFAALVTAYVAEELLARTIRRNY